MNYRLAEISDAVDILNWRNDELTRLMSLSQEEIDWKTHEKWFAKSLANQNGHIYIFSDMN
jgi:hypothetical protein